MPHADGFIHTRIIATLGPASRSVEQVAKLIEEGARVFRINFSHGSFDDFTALLTAVREASARTGVPAGVMGDLGGPKLRIGEVERDAVPVRQGETIAIQKAAVTGARVNGANGEMFEAAFSTNSPDVIDDVEVGHRLFIDDGSVRTIVIEKQGSDGDTRLLCRVTTGGEIRRAKGINLPDSDLRVPSLTEYDHKCIDWAIAHDCDFLALSFVRQPADVIQLKTVLASKLGEGASPPPVVAKIEKPQALHHLEGIIRASDGVMVARGDLGVEMDLTEVPNIQKRIVGIARDLGRPCVVATQMLQSMIENAMPTRAEVSDVANALYDGAGVVMLSGETAVGQYPAQAVSTMARIAATTEHHVHSDRKYVEMWERPPQWQTSGRRSAALALGVRQVVRDFGAKLVVVWSQAGGGARYLSAARVNAPILAFSSDPRALRLMSPLFGVQPMLMEQPCDIEDFARLLGPLLIAEGWGDDGTPYLLVAGEPLGTIGTTNSVSLRYLKDE